MVSALAVAAAALAHAACAPASPADVSRPRSEAAAPLAVLTDCTNQALVAPGAMAVLGGPRAAAEDWPWYGGPNHSGVIADASLTPDGKAMKVLWKAPMLGKGFSGPAVADGEVFILDRRGTGEAGEDVLRVLDLDTGKQRWSFSHPAPGDCDEDKTGLPARCGPVSVPAVTADRLWFSGVHATLFCVDRAARGLVWKREVATTLNWKVHSPSPLLVDDQVVVSGTLRDGGDTVLAFRAADGEPLWRTVCDCRQPQRPGAGVGGVHAPPILATIGGVRQIVVTHRRATFGVEPKTGEVLWQYEGYPRGTIQAEAAVSADGHIFLTSGHDGTSALAQVTRTAGGFAVREIYSDRERGQARACSEWRPGRWWDGHLYHVSNHFAQHGLLCMDTAGHVLWRTKPKGARPVGPLFGQSCLTIVGGVGLAMNGGHLHVIRLSPEKYIELGRIEVFTADETDPGPRPDGRTDRQWADYQRALYAKTWAKHAYSDGRFLTRNHRLLACVRVAEGARR
jgi:hypothetical protein